MTVHIAEPGEREAPLKRPLLLTILMVLLFAFGALMLIGVAEALFRSARFIMQGSPISNAVRLWSQAAVLMALAIVAVVPALALLRKRWWAQHALALSTIVTVAIDMTLSTTWARVPNGLYLILLGFGVVLSPWFWYLYGKRSVVKYFGALRGLRRGG